METQSIRIEFDGREVSAPAGVTVLRAAELGGVHIPTLCYHKDLSPYGGCRMCVVEIDGHRGFPLACCTEATDGMRVRTHTAAVQELRRGVLQLIMSEHPSGCLLCAEPCDKSMHSIRKVGVTTGCRSCPNDEECELQDLVEEIGIDRVDYPILWKGYEAERWDPFFDRNYNLCILCGRCVRMCQELRGTGVLAFNYRGSKAMVGTAFGRDHIEAGCEFCGACISVCPTGTLAEKTSKWDGKPDASVVATCPFCAIGCQFDLWTVRGRFSTATPVLDPLVNDGQACVKGRFCMGEASHHHSRGRKPMARMAPYWREVDWDDALDRAAEALRGASVEVTLSPDCTNETLYAAQKFTRVALGTNALVNTGRPALGALGLWSRLFAKPISLRGLGSARHIVAVGLDTRFNYSIVGVEIRKALTAGATLVTIDSRESNLARYADVWLQGHPGMEGKLLGALARAFKGREVDVAGLSRRCGVEAELLAEALELVDGDELSVVIGPTVLSWSKRGDLDRALRALAAAKGTNLVPLYAGTNTRGAFEVGALAEVLPGGHPYDDPEARAEVEAAWGASLPTGEADTATVALLIGAAPGTERPDADYVIALDIYEPGFEVDLFLPAASFLESDGTLVNVEGRVQAAPRVEEPPDSARFGRVRPDWWVLGQLAERLGAGGLSWASAAEVYAEISKVVPRFPAEPDRVPRTLRTSAPAEPLPPARRGKVGGRFVLVRRPGGYAHRGVDLVAKVEGLGMLSAEQGLYLNPDDAEHLGVGEGDPLRIRAGQVEGTAPARLHPEVPRGQVDLYVPLALGGLEASALEPLYHLPDNPCPVELSRDAV